MNMHIGVRVGRTRRVPSYTQIRRCEQVVWHSVCPARRYAKRSSRAGEGTPEAVEQNGPRTKARSSHSSVHPPKMKPNRYRPMPFGMRLQRLTPTTSHLALHSMPCIDSRDSSNGDAYGLGSPLGVPLERRRYAAEIQKVRVFAGDEHARIIVLNSDKISGLETRSSPATSTAPARATLLLPGATLGKTVQPRIPIGKAGIKQIQIVQVGDGLQFTIELDDARSLTASKIGDSAILLDLLPIDGKPDETLPTAEHIEAWLSGVSLSRMASQTPRISSSLSIQVMVALIMAQSAHKGRERRTSRSRSRDEQRSSSSRASMWM